MEEKHYKAMDVFEDMDFSKLQKAIKGYDALREELIKQSRVVLKLSKLLIYSLHRNDDKSHELYKEIENEKKKLKEIACRSAKLAFEGSYKIGVAEYVEAVLYYHYVHKGELKSLQVEPDYFVLGLADLPGELGRRAVFLAGKGKVEEVVKIKDMIDMIYGELLKFDLRDNESRRKVDSVKYDLRKLEDLVLDLKLKRR